MPLLIIRKLICFYHRRAVSSLLVLLLSATSVVAQAIDPTFGVTIGGTYTGSGVMVLQSDGKILFGGSFESINGMARKNLCRLNVDGSVDTSFAPPSFDSAVLAIAIQSDGKIVVGSSGTSYSGPSIARLNADGSLDASFTAGFSTVQAIAIQADGRILIGALSKYNSSGRIPAIVRLNSDGTTDASFVCADQIGTAKTITLQPDGKILICEPNFALGIARLNTDGSLDSSFTSTTNVVGYDTLAAPVGLQADGRIVVGHYPVRLTSTGARDSSFSANANYTTYNIFPLPNGQVLLIGGFDTFGSLPRNSVNGIARLNSDGSLDPSYRSPLPHGAGGGILQSDGRIVVRLSQQLVRIYEGQILTSPLLSTATFGGSFSYTITATNSPSTFGASGLPTGLTLNPSTGVISGTPTQAGTFNVSLSATGASGTVTGRWALTVAKRAQAVTFTPITASTVGKPLPLTATASSGLPVNFVVVSGNAAINNGSLTLNDNGSVVVRATQPGDTNFAAASADQTISATVQSQVINTPIIATKRNTDSAFIIDVTSSSKLPVTLEIAGGPATISGNTVTLTGGAGMVTVRATQAGNDSFLPASPATFSFTVQAVTPLIYFGTLGTNGELGDFALYYAADSRKGILLGNLKSPSEAFAVEFTADAGGNFSMTTASSAKASNAAGIVSVNHLFRGSINGSVFLGAVDAIPMSGAIAPPLGPTAQLAGDYRASALGATSGTIDSIVSANNRTYVVAITPNSVGGGTGAIDASGNFVISLPAAQTVTGTIDVAAKSVLGKVSGSTETLANFSGVAVGVTPVQRLTNLAMRGVSGQDANALIAGFVITGTAPKPVLLRAVGPGLNAFGITAAVANPRLRLYRGSDLIAENSGWGTILSLTELQSATTRTGAFSLAPGSKDSALYVTLDPGSYTIQASDPNGTGIALAEIYDASAAPATSAQRLVNLSTRGKVGIGEEALIGGFFVLGNSPKKLLIRGVGTTLARFGVSGVVSDPILRVYQQSTLVFENDDWDGAADAGQIVTAASQAVGAFPLDRGSKDAAVVATLAPGSYSIVVSANAVTPGVGLLEIYELSN